jgi:hypothetical protein
MTDEFNTAAYLADGNNTHKQSVSIGPRLSEKTHDTAIGFLAFTRFTNDLDSAKFLERIWPSTPVNGGAVFGAAMWWDLLCAW